MAKKSKKYLAALEKVNREQLYNANEALELVKEIDYAGFDASIEVAYRLGVDPKQADQQIRGAMVLPHGTGKTSTVIVFAKGDQAKAAKEAGADFVGDSDLVEKVQGGWLEFDVVVAAPDMMAEVGKLGRILGPKGLMPNPKTGTVTPDVVKAVNDIKAGQVTYRVDRQSNVHVPIGKVSFDLNKLQENLVALHDTIVKAKPASSKGVYIKNMAVASTFGPGVKVDQTTVGK
ncbi:50S ribosomal protein L1 [Marinilactibacillus psychrotolerans]|uniref:Large ribosomal subunit protein uL1 n=2 Tax=Marinilactibacillus psychrotolerans TaxID=191770 RepID=A0A511H0P1_9LACT|nr:50S ribosomal protein L1 [Marinilactibacillus psychrotolerans]TLQ07941.1 50S ribosomal protein L1 [Marinilactibacillus psychrotolerans]SDC45710.1 large subunit ribosomal protein L1 [Marinilactibacillus psychrotolerans]SJN17073.1 LSU ribosomal protein L1p (L10Ae) [Marinilactibacillus psychrotolerans 42ea]GEL66974.1 50S ribosomal protein L1 [Marinilactibacillus psychrotolerans]GEQ34056.1 50S ribosomal protein L1 [Marinilactibacillus psychrotolerans]